MFINAATCTPGATWTSIATPSSQETVNGTVTTVGLNPGNQGETHFSFLADNTNANRASPASVQPIVVAVHMEHNPH